MNLAVLCPGAGWYGVGLGGLFMPLAAQARLGWVPAWEVWDGSGELQGLDLFAVNGP